VSDPRIGALLRLGTGRWGSVSSPKWREICASMSPAGQRPFAEDQQQGVIARAGRGAGKSYGMAAKFHRPSAAHPGCSSVFITISVERSRDILLPGIWKLNEQFGLGITERKKDNSLVWPNGYRVLLRGCRDRSECNKRRGTPWVLAGWDECDSLNPTLLEYDIHDCVEPRLMDYDGRWFAGGTPGAVPYGYWHKLSSGESLHYPVYAWDARTNPHIPALAHFIGALTRMQGVPARETWPPGVDSLEQIIADPKHWHLLPARFVREYLGQWITDLRALIYRLTAANNYSELPIEPDYVTIGCDLGANGPEDEDLDHAAITVACSHSTLPFIWIPEARRLPDITVDSLAKELVRLCTRYPKATVFLDSASAGKIIEKSYRKWGVPVVGADKGPKLRRIQLAQGAVQNHTLLLHTAGTNDLRHEAVSLVWDETRTLHSPRCSDDVWDSLLYAITPHLGDHRPKAEPLKEGTLQWMQARENVEYEEALREAIERAA
jgi:hypothetical protein